MPVIESEWGANGSRRRALVIHDRARGEGRLVTPQDRSNSKVNVLRIRKKIFVEVLSLDRNVIEQPPTVQGAAAGWAEGLPPLPELHVVPPQRPCDDDTQSVHGLAVSIVENLRRYHVGWVALCRRDHFAQKRRFNDGVVIEDEHIGSIRTGERTPDADVVPARESQIRVILDQRAPGLPISEVKHIISAGAVIDHEDLEVWVRHTAE